MLVTARQRLGGNRRNERVFALLARRFTVMLFTLAHLFSFQQALGTLGWRAPRQHVRYRSFLQQTSRLLSWRISTCSQLAWVLPSRAVASGGFRHASFIRHQDSRTLLWYPCNLYALRLAFASYCVVPVAAPCRHNKCAKRHAGTRRQAVAKTYQRTPRTYGAALAHARRLSRAVWRRQNGTGAHKHAWPRARFAALDMKNNAPHCRIFAYTLFLYLLPASLLLRLHRRSALAITLRTATCAHLGTSTAEGGLNAMAHLSLSAQRFIETYICRRIKFSFSWIIRRFAIMVVAKRMNQDGELVNVDSILRRCRCLPSWMWRVRVNIWYVVTDGAVEKTSIRDMSEWRKWWRIQRGR